MSKQVDKQIIFDLVKEYVKKYHQDNEYQEGDYITYGRKIYDEKEIINLIDASLDFWLTSGNYTLEFENKLKEFLNIKYVSFVNSGSSANLLALNALFSPLLKEKRIKKGDEVITVACGFPTTISPIINLSLVPVFIDIDIPTYNIDITKLEKALSNKTRVVMLAHTLGNPFNIKAVKEFCDKYNLWLIEDNCDALGSKYKLNDDYQYTGTFGDIATSSFFPSHHITTGEGGAIYTNNPLLHKIIRSLRDWGRDCICPPGKDNTCNERFNKQYGDLPLGYDHKYVYSHFGYNLKASDLQASIGVAQMDKLENFIEKRIYNFNYLDKKLKELSLEDKLILPKIEDNSVASPFGYLITCKENVDTNKLIDYLESHNIQTRKLFAGNITKQPCFKDIKEYRIIDDLKNSDIVMNKTFWIGVHPKMNEKMMDYIVRTINEGLKEC